MAKKTPSKNTVLVSGFSVYRVKLLAVHNGVEARLPRINSGSFLCYNEC